MKKTSIKAILQIIIGLIVLFVSIVTYMLPELFHHEKMTYDGMYNVKISVNTKMEYEVDDGYETQYIVNFTATDRDFNLKSVSEKEYYYNYFSKYTDKDSISVPVFKMESGEFFIPLTTEKCSEKRASDDYAKYIYTEDFLQPLFVLGLLVGGLLLLGGLINLYTGKKQVKVKTVETGIFDETAKPDKEKPDASSCQIKSNPDDCKEILDEQLGTSIFRKNKARFLAEEYPHADPDEIARYHKISKDEFIAAKRELRSEKYGIFSHEEKGVADILMGKEGRKNK